MNNFPDYVLPQPHAEHFLKYSSFTSLYIKSKSSLLKVKLVDTSSCVLNVYVCWHLGKRGQRWQTVQYLLRYSHLLCLRCQFIQGKTTGSICFVFLIMSLDTKWREASKWLFFLKEKNCRKTAAFNFQAVQLLQKMEIPSPRPRLMKRHFVGKEELPSVLCFDFLKCKFHFKISWSCFHVWNSLYGRIGDGVLHSIIYLLKNYRNGL